jgi:predicted nucleotidyltransferase component of viral defense system
VSDDRQHRVAVSVRDRLLNLARAQGQPFDLVLVRYVTERLLYRLSLSEWRDQFIVKGATLFALWADVPHRPTRDLDLLGPPLSPLALRSVFEKLSEMSAPEDGVIFSVSSLQVQPIRGPDAAGGMRIKLNGRLAGARVPVQVDVGFGDIVVPSPVEAAFPTLLAMPAVRVLACTRYTMVAEKLQAMVVLGMANSRMKDYYDLWVLSQRFGFDGTTLLSALRATFAVRRTILPIEAPVALSEEFAANAVKQTQWRAFLQRTRIGGSQPLADVVAALDGFLVPPMTAGSDASFPYLWAPGGPWT